MKSIIFRKLISAAVLGTVIVVYWVTPAFAHRPYLLDQQVMSDRLNDFWSIYGTSEGARGVRGWEDVIHPATCWYEWNTLKVSWTNYGNFRKLQRMYFDDTKITGINCSGEQASGYVWPGAGNEKWFGLHYHFDQMPRFICAVYNEYMWSRDKVFLSKMMPSLEAILDYLLNSMQGKDGPVICPGEYNGLPNVGAPSTYMDAIREGHIVAWINAGFYTALQNMAELEDIVGNSEKSRQYKKLTEAFPTVFDKYLWNDSTHRYAGWRDSNNQLHDAGYTYVNIDALARGLGSASKALDIFDWLSSNQAQPTVKGGHIGSRDVYQLVVAPRTNTSRIPDADWDPWSHIDRPKLGDSYQYGYGALVEDGGTMLWLNYYDVMARLRWTDADDAWRRLGAMLNRCAEDPKFLVHGHDHRYDFQPKNARGEHFLELGTDNPFPESGISGMSMLYGFMGVKPNESGLEIRPNLPSQLLFAQCSDIAYGGKVCSIRVRRGKIVQITQIGSDGSFTPHAQFSRLGALVNKCGNMDSVIQVTLRRLEQGTWRNVFVSNAPLAKGNSWTYFAVPPQPGGCKYRLVLMENGQDRIACESIRAVDDCLSPVITARKPQIWSIVQSPNTIEQTFIIRSCFSRISVLLRGASKMGTSAIITLYRRMGNRWRTVASQWFAISDRIVSVPMNISDQPAGEYRVVLQPYNGMLEWQSTGDMRESNYIVVADKCKYSINIFPENKIAMVNAGDAYVFR